MIFPIGFHQHYFQYLLKRDVTKLYVSIAIRNLAIGMVAIFGVVYWYLYFDKSIAFTLLFLGVMYGMHGVLVPLSGKVMAKIGAVRNMLLSSVFYIAYYLSLVFMTDSSFLVPFAISVGAIGMALFWPAFHTDFVRLSSQSSRGQETSKVNVAVLLPTVLSPVIGGIILSAFGFPVLFAMVSIMIFASTLPLFYSQEHHEVYTDSYTKSWSRMFKKENRSISIGFLSESLEVGIDLYIWPLFLFTLAVSFSLMGGITSAALIVSSIFMLYVGRITDTQERPWLLNVGALWTAVAWILKYFVRTPFDALLAHMIYRVSKSAARIPFQALMYEKAATKGAEADEFIIYFTCRSRTKC